MKRIDWLPILLWGLVAFCVFGIFMSVRQSTSFSDGCRARGGVPMLAKHAYMCLDPKALR